MSDFAQDCAALALEKLERGQLDRRQFIKALGALGLVGAGAAAPLGRAAAQAPKEVVIANWGGIAVKAMTTSWAEPFEKNNPGWKAVIDGSGPSAGKIQNMAQSGKVVWDICDSGAGTAIDLAKRGLLEPIDYAIVDKSKVIDGFTQSHGVACYSFSSVLCYDAEKFKADPPKTWADFWDLKKYPGKRMLRKDIQAVMEAALMADGVPMDKLYPIDQKRAFKKIDEIRKNVVFWGTGAESEQILRTGEAVMGLLWHTRAKVLFDETKGKLDFTFNQGVLQPGMFIVPKGNPSGKGAQLLLASIQDPAGQVELLKILGNGPVNPAAAPLIPPEWKRFDPSSPGNRERQVIFDGPWYGENQPRVLQDYLDLISS
jgi:putative spermidine/putrescine transport system substrate-binding protein